MYRFTYDEWLEKYQPIKNHFVKYDSLAFETYGEELDYVIQQHGRNVWTEVDGFEGSSIINGYHFVNRIQYYITANPWTEATEVPLTIDKECSCMSEGDAKIDCGECGGVGYMTFYIDTREELEMIYGPQDV